MMNKMMIILGVLSLSGCAGIYEESFECSVGEGMRCSSLSKVNNAMDKSQIVMDKGEMKDGHETAYGSSFSRDMRG